MKRFTSASVERTGEMVSLTVVPGPALFGTLLSPGEARALGVVLMAAADACEGVGSGDPGFTSTSIGNGADAPAYKGAIERMGRTD